MKDLPAVLRYARRLIVIDFVVALVGAFAGVQLYFWQATIHCGH